MKRTEFDFDSTLNKANKIESIEERILFLKKELKEFKQQDGWDIDMDRYEDKIIQEIKYLDELPKSNNKSPVQININPIWWQKSNRLLGYLIEELAKSGFIDRKTDINKLIKQHFIDQNKNPFKDSIAQNRSGSGINKNNKPNGYKDIDKIINDLKQPKKD